MEVVNRVNKNLIFKNAFTVLIYRIFLIMFLLTLSRIGFWFFNHDMFPVLTTREFFSALRGGVVFDLSAVVYYNMLFILMQVIPFDFRYNKVYQEISKWIFFVVNFLMLAMNGADCIYYRFLGKRATADVFGTFRNEENLGKLFFKFMTDYWQVTLFTLLLVVLMVYLYGKVKLEKPIHRNKFVYFGVNLIIFPLTILFIVGAARGGFKHSTRPITISNAARYVNDPRNVGIVLNTPFSILRTWGKKELVCYNFFDEEQLVKIYNPHYRPAPIGNFCQLNVIIIILESFGREYIGFYNKNLDGGSYKGYTPFLDSLLAESLTFDVSLANGNKSIDAMPSILASLPSLETPYIISHYANNTINGLPSLLRKKGYYSAFFHGAPNGSMGFDSFSKMAGFEDYFGKNEYHGSKEDYDGMWGLWDEPFMQFFASKLDSFKQPFIASIFTISSHHPFKVPEKYEEIFEDGPIPICKTIRYSDYALKRFFDEVKGKPWFDSTLFVITADHTNEIIFKEYQNTLGHFSVPVAFYMHNSNLKGMKNRIAQQIDIMPSVLGFLNYDEEYIAFGNNVFDEDSESFAFNTIGNTYCLFMDDYVLEMIDNKTVRLINYKTDRYFENNLAGQLLDIQKRMEEKLLAIIQTYNCRLLNNDLIVKN